MVVGRDEGLVNLGGVGDSTTQTVTSQRHCDLMELDKLGRFFSRNSRRDGPLIGREAEDSDQGAHGLGTLEKTCGGKWYL